MKNVQLKLNALSVGVLLAAVALPTLSQAATVGGNAYLTVDQAAWATVLPQSSYWGAGNQSLYGGRTGTMADADGYRFMYVSAVFDHTVAATSTATNANNASDARIAAGTAVPSAVALWRVPHAQEVPVTQPSGGFTFQVDPSATAGTANPGWGANYTASAYDSVTNPTGKISMGGSIRMASDVFNSARIAGNPDGLITDPNQGINPNSTSNVYNPNGGTSVQWRNLDVRYLAGNWYIGAGTGPGAGSIFELINPVFGISAVNGLATLEADYQFGDSDWYGFLSGSAPDINPNLVLGHLSINPELANPVPVPAGAWLFGGALFSLVKSLRRKLNALPA